MQNNLFKKLKINYTTTDKSILKYITCRPNGEKGNQYYIKIQNALSLDQSVFLSTNLINMCYEKNCKYLCLRLHSGNKSTLPRRTNV